MPIWQESMLEVYSVSTLNIDKGQFDKPTKTISIEIDCNKYNDIVPDSLETSIIDKSDIF